MEENQFTIYIKPVRKRFYGNGNWGIYVVEVAKDSPNQERIDGIDDLFCREINMVGVMPELESEALYVASVEEKNHPKFGVQYEVSTIYKKPLTTADEQKQFLSSLVTAKQFESILSAYPNENLIDLIKEDMLDVNLVSGLGDKTYQKIKDKIKESERYETAIIELGKFGLNFKAISSLSDKYGSPDLLVQKVNENPYILTELDGYGFKRVDEIAMKLGVDKKSKNRIMSCVEFVLNEQANDGHCWVKRTKAISETIKLLNVRISDVEEVINGDDDKKFECDDKRIYMKRYKDYERGIADNIRRLLEAKVEYSIPDIEGVVKEVEEKQGFKFTDEQKKAICLSINNNFLVVSGRAGSGKTTVIKGIVEALKKINDLEYTTCTLAGKASQRIQEATGLESATLHRTLGYNPHTGWAYDEFNNLGHDVIILDETSMVNSQLFYYLIRAIKDGAKLIVTGDDQQLSPIGAGNVFFDLLNCESVPKIELTKVHRQAQMSGILSNANMVRDGVDFTEDLDERPKRLGELNDLYYYPKNNKEQVFKNIMEISKRYHEDVLDFQVVAPMKNRGLISTQNLNNELQKIFNKNPDIVDDNKKIIRKQYSIIENDKVIMKKNDYTHQVFNGTIGIVEHIDLLKQDGEIIINFEGVGRIFFKKEEIKNIELAYALTCHSTQGSQWKYVILALDYSSYVLLDKQLVYTAMTRASEALFMPVELKALKYAIRTDKSSKRNTFLNDFINEHFKNRGD